MTTAQESLVFRIDDRLLQRRPPRLTLAATLRALCKQVKSGELDANFVVDILNENRLLPYMIGRSKNLIDISLGRNINASKIGDLVVSEECIRGTYELCMSFLEFVLAVIRSSNFRDTTKTILASIIYIANEIYTSHHIWTYRDINDMNRILCLCTEIFHHIISNSQEPTKEHKYSELEIVCILNLSHNQAHKQLLDVIVDGKNTIRHAIEKMDSVSELNLRNSTNVMSVRQSLYIFNKLLSHSRFLKDYCDINKSSQINSTSPTSHYQHGASSSTAPVTYLERALFDTSIRPGLLQHLFSFIYQKDDSSTACLAVDLIKKIAKKFSMSLMACLGSEADKVCEFFIDCLGNKEANIDLEVAILDLLSTCVKHQPGLIELFLNSKGENTNGSSKQDSTTKLVSIEVIRSLLKECKARQEDSYKLLHTYVMKFILTFWQRNHSAIELFDQADEFWESIAYPLSTFTDTNQNTNNNSNTQHIARADTYVSIQTLNDELNSYALMILAREIFCLNAGISERKMNPKLISILDELSKKNLLGKYSTYIKKRYSKISENFDKGKDYNRILAAWRDFLISYAKHRPFEIDSVLKRQIIDDIMVCMITELRLGEKLDKERIDSTGESLLLIWTKWMPKTESADNMFNSIHELLYLTDSLKDYLPFSFLLTFQSTLNLYLVRHRDSLIQSKRSFDLLVPALQMMHFGFKIMEKSLAEQTRCMEFEYKPSVESRLCLASIMMLRFIIDVSRNDVNLWAPFVKINLKLDSLVQFLSLLMNKRAGSEICLAMVELLLCLSSIQETADYLNKAALINQVNMISSSAYERPYAHLSQLASIHPINKSELTSSNQTGNDNNNERPVDGKQAEIKNLSALSEISFTQTTAQANPTTNNNLMSDTTKIYLDNVNSDHKWLPIHCHVIRLNISMLLTLNGDYMTTAIEFLSIHCLRICELLELLRTKPRAVNMEEAIQMIHLINLTLRQSRMWKRKNKQSYEAISDEIGKTAYTLATSALPPPTTGQPGDGQQHSSIKPRDCLVYARCCYDFGKYTEAERVLFQTKFGDKLGFINEAGQIYGEELSKLALHLAAQICVKTNRQADSIDFALQVFADDLEYLDIVNALNQSRA